MPLGHEPPGAGSVGDDGDLDAAVPDPVGNRPGLAEAAATGNGHIDIELVCHVDQLERLADLKVQDQMADLRLKNELHAVLTPEQLEKANMLTRFPRAALNALSLMKVTGTSLPELLEEGIAMKQSQELTWAQLAMAANAPMLTKASMVDGKIEAGILPTGQIAGVIDEIPTVAELLQRIVAEAEQTLDRLGA